MVENASEPQLQDFGVTSEEYAVYTAKDREFPSWSEILGFPVAVFVFFFVLMYLSRVGDSDALATAFAFGLFFTGVLAVFGIAGLVGIAVARYKKSSLLKSPVASRIKLYEESRTAYYKVQWEAEKERREAERARKQAETARLEVERARRRKFEDYWMSLNGTEFEQEMARVLRALGYRVKSTPSSGDGGVDLILTRSGKTIVVQCKAHKNPVGPAIARELFGSMIHFKADQAVLACTGGFTGGVKHFVRDKPIELVSLSELVRLGAQVEGKEIRDTPICTKCERAMVLKHGRRGAFWGCSRYPKCRESRDANDW